MSETPFMPLWVGDFLAKTTDLGTKEIGAYLLILMTMWAKGGSIPNDQKTIQRVARMGRDWPGVWAKIEHYFVVDGGRIYQDRLSEELQKVVTKRRVNAHSGARGGLAKARKSNELALANATNSLQRNPSNHNHTHKEEKISTPTLAPNSQSLGARSDKSPRRNAARLEADWTLPEAWLDWAMAQKIPEPAVRREAERFADYWRAKARKDAAKLDWLGTWRNWIRRAQESPAAARNGYGHHAEIPDAKPVRFEPGVADFNACARSGAPDLPGMQRGAKGQAPADPMPLCDDDERRLADLLPPLRPQGRGQL